MDGRVSSSDSAQWSIEVDEKKKRSMKWKTVQMKMHPQQAASQQRIASKEEEKSGRRVKVKRREGHMDGGGMLVSESKSVMKMKKELQAAKRRSIKKGREARGKVRADGRVSSSSSRQNKRRIKMKERRRKEQQRVMRCSGKREKERLIEKGKMGSVETKVEMSAWRREGQ